MRDLAFWQEKYDSARNRAETLNGKVSYHEAIVTSEGFKLKLKSQYGHALNRDYTGHKIHKRRNQWLKQRMYHFTSLGKARRELKKLRTTKIPFYAKKIRELGGQASDHWLF